MLTEWKEASGRLDAKESVEIRPRVTGHIDRVTFQSGQLVKKGDVLFVIDPRWYQAALASAEAQLARAQVNLANATREWERNRQLEGQLYAQWQFGDSYLLGRVSHGVMERQARRDVLLGDMSFGVGSDYDNRYTSMGLQLGQRWTMGDGGLTPYVGLQAVRMTREGFTEEGAAGFGLSTHASTFEASQALAGLRFDHQWWAGATQLGINGRVEWQRTLSQSGNDINARFTGIDVWSPIVGETLARDIGVLGLGLQARFPGLGVMRLGADLRDENGQRWTQAQLGWAIGF